MRTQIIVSMNGQRLWWVRNTEKLIYEPSTYLQTSFLFSEMMQLIWLLTNFSFQNVITFNRRLIWELAFLPSSRLDERSSIFPEFSVERRSPFSWGPRREPLRPTVSWRPSTKRYKPENSKRLKKKKLDYLRNDFGFSFIASANKGLLLF